MTVIWTEGNAKLECSEIEVCGTDFLCDGVWIVPINEVEKIIN